MNSQRSFLTTFIMALLVTIFSNESTTTFVSAFTLPTTSPPSIAARNLASRSSFTSPFASAGIASSNILIMAAGPAVIDSPATIEKTTPTIEDDKTTDRVRAKTPMWEIRLFNDPFNKREFVARCLAEVCGKSDTESFQIMMQAHRNGMGMIGRYDFELAELYFNSLKEQGLVVDMVQVDDDE